MFIATVVISVVVLFFLLEWKKKNRTWKIVKKIPGPTKYPIIGNLLDVMKPADEMFLKDREYSRKYYPIYLTSILQHYAVVLIHPEDIELVLTNTKHNTKSVVYEFLHPWLGTGLLTSADSKWQTRRKILTPAFHFSILQQFINIFNEETQRLVEDLKERCKKSQVIDVIPPITAFTLKSIGETSMGTTLTMTDKEQAKYRDNIYKIGEFLTHRITRPWLYPVPIYNLTEYGEKSKRYVNELHNFTEKVIADRKKEFKTTSYSSRKRLAMLDLLLKYRADGADIDDEGIREEVDTFMFEGHDTTSMALTYLLMTLANHKEIQNKIFKEIQQVLGDDNQPPSYAVLNDLKYMERCIKEGLRLYPSVPFIARMSGEDIVTRTGYTIPKQSSIHIHIYDLHHSPEIYPEPEKFDPDRFLLKNIKDRHPFAYLPFSGGSRNCIGQKFAILELKAVLCGIIGKFVLEPVDKPEDIVFISDLVLRSKGQIRVKFVERYFI